MLSEKSFTKGIKLLRVFSYDHDLLCRQAVLDGIHA